MLGQIEFGQSAPTINVLWKIAPLLPGSSCFATEVERLHAGLESLRR